MKINLNSDYLLLKYKQKVHNYVILKYVYRKETGQWMDISIEGDQRVKKIIIWLQFHHWYSCLQIQIFHHPIDLNVINLPAYLSLCSFCMDVTNSSAQCSPTTLFFEWKFNILVHDYKSSVLWKFLRMERKWKKYLSVF